jgi:hypothetical protein
MLMSHQTSSLLPLMYTDGQRPSHREGRHGESAKSLRRDLGRSRHVQGQPGYARGCRGIRGLVMTLEHRLYLVSLFHLPRPLYYFLLLNSPHLQLDEIVVACNGSPIAIGLGAGRTYIASEPAAFNKYTKNFIAMQVTSNSVGTGKRERTIFESCVLIASH